MPLTPAKQITVFCQSKICYTRNKPKRNALPKDLPREVVVYDIADEDKICACC